MASVFVAMDGDDMGSTVEDVLLDNDTVRAEALSQSIHAAFEAIEAYVGERGGDVIFRGGDNILFSIPDKIAQEVSDGVRDLYLSKTEHSATVGVGTQPLDAHRALVVGKNTGKNKTVVWGKDQSDIYEKIKARQQEIRECIDEGGADVKYEASLIHFERLVGAGYDKAEAMKNVVAYNPSFRDWILKRRKHMWTGKHPLEQLLRDGEEQYEKMVNDMEKPSLESTQTMQSAEPVASPVASPVMGQKVVSADDFGRVSWVGPRFISVRWVKAGKLQRFGRRRFDNAVQAQHFVLLPKIRVAQNVKKGNE